MKTPEQIALEIIGQSSVFEDERERVADIIRAYGIEVLDEVERTAEGRINAAYPPVESWEDAIEQLRDSLAAEGGEDG